MRGGDGPRVIVAHSESRRRSRLAAILKRLGCRVALADSGPRALEELRRHPDALMIILDMGRRSSEGLRVLDRMNQEPGRCRVPAVMLVVGWDASDVALALTAGADFCLLEPVTASDLGLIVRSLQRAAGERRADATEALPFVPGAERAPLLPVPAA